MKCFDCGHERPDHEDGCKQAVRKKVRVGLSELELIHLHRLLKAYDDEPIAFERTELPDTEWEERITRNAELLSRIWSA